ncbi:MAG TPA: hypothetical protein VK890_00900 [Bacteroidia bacterium]|jgi:hypothetical protein|nr:hypothetical protein [Bacteroidia bacterium]
MKIIINDHRKIFAIQKAFSEMFPFLKLEFLAKPGKVGGASPKKMLISPSKTIGQCRVVHSKGTLTILAHMTVSDLEQSFNDTFGLSVRVFRKSGKVWLETSATDMWTLEKENEIGKEMDSETAESEVL